MLSTFLNGIIRFALQNRMLVAALAVLVLLLGGWQILQLPIDVFPNLNRPRVVVMTEAHGLAPEEVESLVTLPLETVLNGATGVQVVRSSSGVGISVVKVEFDWGVDPDTARVIVNERIALATEHMPKGVKPHLAPRSSIMGQIVIVGMISQLSDETLAFTFPGELSKPLDAKQLPTVLRQSFVEHGIPLSEDSQLEVQDAPHRWVLTNPETKQQFTLVQANEALQVHRTTSPMEMRTLADWVVQQQLRGIKGVSQVFVMGGERKQFQVLVKPDLLLKYGVTLHEVESALERSNQNATGGYLDDQGPNATLVRAIGRIQTIRELEQVVVKHRDGRSIVLAQIARVIEGAQVKLGDSSAYVRRIDHQFVGGDAVVLTINKQPGADTRGVTEQISSVLAKIEKRLPKDVKIISDLYQQKAFIDIAIKNVEEALLHGGILVVIILFVFLLNFRTTFITLTAIPLSIVVTGLVFHIFGLSINTMTLGGIAVAIGELVDDAIVDVENIFRRLRENRQSENPKSPLLVVFQASVEVRNSIVFGTVIVVLVFIPLFALSGMEGRLFTPLGIAYIVSILSSLLVSLTVTPVLSYWLLPKARVMAQEKEGFVLRFLQQIASFVIRMSLRISTPILLIAALFVGVAGLAVWQLENDFLPPFNEGAVQINVLMPPGTSLQKTNEVARIVDQRLQELDDIQTLVRKTGRAELDEHAEGVHVSEYIASLNPNSLRSREEIIDDIRTRLAEVPGIVIAVEQPLSHLINHMLTGVKAHIAIKVVGDDLEMMKRKADEMKAAIAGVAGVKDLQVEQQVFIPQLRIEVDGSQLVRFGLTRGDVTELIETAMNGRLMPEMIIGQRKFDLLLRLDESTREDLESLKRLTIPLPGGGTTKLNSVANIYLGDGPNTINREQVRRRVILKCNVSGRGLVDVVRDIKARVQPIEATLPEGYHLEYGGQFQNQESASRVIAILFSISLVGVFLVLYTMFGSANLALQVMVALPMAFIGSVAALYITGQTLTVAAMVGFISLCGIASRNGILLINHYLHLVEYEGEQWTGQLIVRAGKERLAPVLMTALTSGIGLVPLAMATGEPGKEILYPVATVIIGGLISSTVLEFFVRPALFWQFGMKAGKRVVENKHQSILLVEENVEQ